tara:strand:+ start:9800 stop:12046 length:2247 start_codon:yes stop_codon:yes gene_type:complete
MDLKMNSFQTPLTDELKDSLPKEVWEDIVEYIASVKFIERLIAPEETRGFAKDRPRETEFYDDGRILVDVTDPHILEDMAYFRQSAIYFEKHGVYTHIIPNSNPKSDYAQWWIDELHKWRYGMVRESDGEWISGYLYFYWNYSPIWLIETEDKVIAKKNSKKGNRVKKFPKPWLGDYLFFHYIQQCRDNGQHAKNLKTRGIGMSFKNAAMSPRNMYVFPGTGNANFHLANEKSFLSGDKGIFGKILDCLDHIADNTPLPKLRLQDSKRDMMVQLGYQDEYGIRKGILSSVMAISLKDNPDKARGVRGVFCHYEEDGLFDNLEKAWNVNRAAFEDGGVAFGLMLAAGTGGVEGGSFEGSEKLFYSPGAYNVYSIPNVFDKNTDGSTECGHFWGAYLNRNGCYESENGEPDIIKALVEICSERHVIKYSSSDANAITQKKAELPITPQEAVMRTQGTVFPVADLKEYLEQISTKKDAFLAENYVGEIVYDKLGEVKWQPNSDLYPLRTYDIAGGDKTGALEIFEMPRKNSEGLIARGRYIAGIDPIDSDTGKSLFSMLIMDSFTDRIVAEYSGRPRTANQAYEITLRALKFYNAEANYESNLKGLFSYFDKHNALHYLADVPQILKDMDFVKSTNLYGNKAKGTRANKTVNSWGRLLQADWQRTKAYGGDEDDSRLNLHRLRGLAYIEECIKWNADGNFDRVSAGIMLFILREDKAKRTESIKKHGEKSYKTLSQDTYFTKNYKNNFKLK